MKLLVMSDSHGRSGKVKKMIAQNADADGIIYLGDGESDLESALAFYGFFRDADGVYSADSSENILNKQVLPVCQVRGNCDRVSSEAVTLIREFGGVRFYITHGYEQGVKYGLDKLAACAKAEGCTAALFGHTHGVCYTVTDGVELFNPGSAAVGSFGVITIENGIALFEHGMLD